MIAEPKCSKRECVHLIGVKQDDEDERTERNYCLAFPDGIPDEIAYGDNLHLQKFPKQKTSYIYEKDPRA
jgi:hypothetical protein